MVGHASCGELGADGGFGGSVGSGSIGRSSRFFLPATRWRIHKPEAGRIDGS